MNVMYLFQTGYKENKNCREMGFGPMGSVYFLARRLLRGRAADLGIPVLAEARGLQCEGPDSQAGIVTALMNNMHAARSGGLICSSIDDPPTPAFRKPGLCLFERIESEA
jgi:hypothetical protein